MRPLLPALALFGLGSCEEPADPVADSADDDPVAAAVAREGSARVLVRLPDDPADAALRGARGADRATRVAHRSERIRRESAALVAALPRGARAVQTYDHVPVVVLDLDDPAAVGALRGRGLDVDLAVAYEASLATSLPLVHQPEAAAEGFTGAGTTVAVLDTGADWTQADLGSCTAVNTPAACRVVYAQDFAADDGSRDDNGHGTNVSSIVAGVAPGADVIALDVFLGASAWSNDILAAIDWVIANRDAYDIVAINLSLGSGRYFAPCADVFASGITSAHLAGVSVVVASGNNAYTDSISSPACSTDAFSVGSVYAANFGPIGWSSCSDTVTAADRVSCFSNTASFLDVLAPGALITAGGRTLGGTSMAAPHVAGAVAVVAAADPDLTVDELEDALVANGTPIVDHRTGLTFPRLDVAASVRSCVSALSSTGEALEAGAGGGDLDVTADAGCAWTAASDAAWLTVSPADGVGSGTVHYDVTANTSASARVGHLTIGGRRVDVEQAGVDVPTGTVQIAGGAAGTATTAVTLTLTTTTGTEVCVSNTPTCSAWVAFAGSKAWTLASGAGTKTVYATFRDAGGNVGPAATDTIVLDTTRPTDGTLTVARQDGALGLSWTGYADAGSGVAGYRVAAAAGATAPSNCLGALAWSGTDLSTTLTGLTNGQTTSVRVCAVDGAGNVSTGRTASAAPAPELDAPTGGSILLAGGAAYTRSRSVTAALAATDASGVSQRCVSTTATCSAWAAMADSAAVSLPSTNGVRTVWAWYRDPWGNTSAPVTDTIVLDTVLPTNGTLAVTPSDGQLAVSWSGVTDANGIVGYALRSGASLPASCTAGTEAWAGTDTATTLTGLPNGTPVYLRLCATDAAGNVSVGATASGTPASEFTAPTGSILLDAGAAWSRDTSLDVALDATDDTGVASRCLSATATCSAWAAYAPTTTFAVSGTGTKTVYAWFRDANGNVGGPFTDTIGVDNRAPTNPAIVATPQDGAVSLALTGASDTISGLAGYKVAWQATSAPSSCAAGTVVEVFPAASPVVVSGLTNGSTYGFRVCAVDVAGNASAGATTTSRAAPELVPPTGTLLIAGDAAWTRSRTVTLNLTGADASGVATMCLSTSTSCSTYVPFAEAPPFTLSSGDGTKTVRAWLRDPWGNTSAALLDTIGLDATVPSGGTVTAVPTAGGADLSWSGFTDARSGVVAYRIAAQAGTAPTSCASYLSEVAGTTGSISGFAAGVSVGVRVCAVDAAGNVSAGAVRAVTPL